MNTTTYNILKKLVNEKLNKKQTIVKVELNEGESNYDEAVVRLLSESKDDYRDFDIALSEYDENFRRSCFLILIK